MARGTLWMACSVLLGMGAAHAEGSQMHAFIGGWDYRITGTTESTSRLDLQDDLGLKSTDRKTYALGITPGQPGWLPALALDYTRITADGQQQVSVLPVAGLPVAVVTQVDDRTDINDTELNARWPYQLGNVTLSGGLSLTWVNGTVTVADQGTAQQQTQRVNQVFPLLSVAAQWQATKSLRFTLSGDYIQYKDNRADEIEARVLWKFLGPIGLEGGYLRRHYKISDPTYRLNAKVGGARLGLVIEIPY